MVRWSGGEPNVSMSVASFIVVTVSPTPRQQEIPYELLPLAVLTADATDTATAGGKGQRGS